MENGITLEVWIGIVGVLSPILIGIGWLIFRIGGLYAKIIEIDLKVKYLFRRIITVSDSPMVLNDLGKKILKETNIQDFTDKYFDQIVESVDKLNPRNAYEAQECLIEIMEGFKKNPLFKDELEEISLKSKSNLNAILCVGAVNIRDEVIERLSFRREDIDKFDPNKP